MTSCNRLARLLIFILAATSLSCLESAAAFDPLSLGQSINGNSRLIQPDAADVGVPTSVNPEQPILPYQQTSQRRGPRPTRRKSLTRRPRYYWRDVANVEYELREFWSQLQILIPKSEPPPIPNESLLRHMGRHNLRAAILAHGGRELLSEQLGGARIIPGKWTEAVATSPELQQLIDPTQNQRNCDLVNTSDGSKKDKDRRNQQQPSFSINLHRDIPPWSLPQATKETNSSLPEETLESLKRKRWCHTEGRNPKGYWSLQQVIQELYEYLDDCKSRHGRPAVWMPRPSEIGAAGRVDLHQAFSRFGGLAAITQLAGLVPFREWNYFEGQYRMLLELKRYLDEFYNSDYSTFPTVLEMQRHGYDELHTLIQYYGGRKFVASRLSMEFTRKSSSRGRDFFGDMQWGAFDLEFGIELLHFIREDQLKLMPPMAKPVIAMPSQNKLLSTTDGRQLVEGINKYGGYENVARRLGLAFFD